MTTAPPLATPAIEMSFHHVGVAVKSIDAALEYYTGLFGLRQVSEPLEVPGEHVRVCFLEAPHLSTSGALPHLSLSGTLPPSGGTAPGVLIELVEGIGEKSPVADIVSRTGAGPYHLCYRVDDLDAAIRRLRAGGCLRLKRFERPGPGPGRFAFLLTPDRQLFELCEAADGENV
ncbi:MAG: methylmalonyl-CoA epimerase [bacterium]|nr:methylmalonyl-CoA epimerase [bacterium]